MSVEHRPSYGNPHESAWGSSSTDQQVSACAQPFPSNFLCSEGTTCLALTSDYSAALCCPSGQTCSLIAPISCDAQLWNATAFPNNQVHSSVTVTLSQCGQSCCPVGYQCQAEQCVKNSSHQQLVQATQRSTFVTQTTTLRNAMVTTPPSTTTTTRSTSISLPTSVHSPGNTPASNPSGLSATTRALISVLAVLFAILIIAIMWYYLQKRHQSLKTAAAVRQAAPTISISKAELEGSGNRIFVRPPAEMSGVRSIRELSAVYCARHRDFETVRFHHHMSATSKRPSTLNSAPRELDAALAKDLDVGTKEWI